MAANQARKPGTTVGGNRPSAFDKMYMFCLVASGMSTELSEKNNACVTVGRCTGGREEVKKGGQLAKAVFFLYIYIYMVSH